jgi:hypothetical protein
MAVVLLVTNSLSAQSAEDGRAGERAVLERSLEMDLARSAAPPTVSEEDTVLLWNGHGFDVGHEGSTDLLEAFELFGGHRAFLAAAVTILPRRSSSSTGICGSNER